MNDTTVFNEKINECLTVDPTKLTHQQKSVINTHQPETWITILKSKHIHM